MLFTQSIDACFSVPKVQNHFKKFYPQAEMIAETLDQFTPLTICRKTEDLTSLIELADQLKSQFKHFVILGTGGSTLCPQTLTALQLAPSVTLHYADYIDPVDSLHLKEQLPLEKTCLIAISKSGATIETLAQVLWWKQQYQNAKITDIGRHFIMINDPGPSPLRTIAEEINAPILDHIATIGGRYASFSNVGLLPALLAGLDIYKIRAGAKTYLDNPGYAIQGAALAASFFKAKIPNMVYMPYVRRLKALSILFRQLWAESLGKNGNGGTPIPALGTLDQHSQLQLYLDGPKDKWFTIITLDTTKQGGPIPTHPSCSYLQHHDLGDVQDASQHATVATLIHHGRPTRIIHLSHLEERTLGALIMHTMIETIITAKLIGVDPFDQPAVESGKMRVRQLLQSGSLS